MSKEQYTSVSEMISGISDDAQFNKEMDDRLCSRQIIKSLVAMRAARGVSQSDIARELGCTQSRVSKIENGFDGDLQLSDLSAYAKVLGLEFQLLTAKRALVDSYWDVLSDLRAALAPESAEVEDLETPGK